MTMIMESPQQLKITSITLTMEGEAMESAVTAVNANVTNVNEELEWHHRFKVVKVYGEPYRRGRFLCNDYKEPDDRETINYNDNTNINGETIDGDNTEIIQFENSVAHDHDDGELISGGQTSDGVAIDNKIEQAMDLVKSHLMFAVREEVDVLKERITELSERITTLEAENSLLRQHIDEETLSNIFNQLNQQKQSQNQSPNGGS